MRLTEHRGTIDMKIVDIRERAVDIRDTRIPRSSPEA